MKTSTWIIIFAAAVLICGAVYIIMPFFGGEGHTAQVYQDGELLYTIDLDKVEESYEITLESGESTNTVLVERGRISICRSDCPDKTCVNHGPLEEGGTPIICLPNKVVIKWGGQQEEIDGVVG